jgi:predicted amidohydrolase YtcJ
MGSTKAGLVLHNANIITLDQRNPLASTIYIQGGRILKVSSTGIDRRLTAPGTEIIDCAGKTVIPGFHDAHCHVVSYAESLVNVDVSPARVGSIEDIVCKISQAATQAPPGNWIRCAGYNEFYLAEKRHPTRQDLDRATTAHPVKLTHRSGHAHVLNSLAMSMAGITNETGEPPGGMIERDIGTGEPNGLLYGMGPYLGSVIPPLSDSELDLAVAHAGKMLLGLGITSVQDASPGNGSERWNKLLDWKKRRQFAPRTVLMFGPAELDNLPMLDKGYRLSTGAVKIVLDEVRGGLNPPQSVLNSMVASIHSRDLQIAIHAVEEGTVDAAVEALSYAQAKYPHRSRHRVEHCSICTPATARKLVSLGAMVVTNPAFIYYSGERYLATVSGPQREHLYAVNTMLAAGLKVAAGSDAPVAGPDPLIGIYAAVTRKAETGQKVLPGQSVSALDALRLYTVNAAYSCFREDHLGSLSAGKYADLAVLDNDPLSVSPHELKDIKVDTTILAGKVVYRRQSQAMMPDST